MGIATVIREQVEALTRPTTSVLADLRQALTDYEDAVVAQCQRVVEAPLLEHIGGEPEPEADIEEQRRVLQRLLDRTLSLIRKPTAPREVLPEVPRILAVEPVEARPTPYPNLQKTYPQEGSIVMVGGFKVPGKLDSITEAYGLVLDWMVFEKGSPRLIDAIVARIKQRKVGAIVILEGFMTHKDYRKISTACKNSTVPYAMGGKGGHGELRMALESLESRLRRVASSA